MGCTFGLNALRLGENTGCGVDDWGQEGELRSVRNWGQGDDCRASSSRTLGRVRDLFDDYRSAIR